MIGVFFISKIRRYDMAYNGYLLKIGDYIVPEDKFIKADSYLPYVVMQDIDDWTDANGKLHRNVVELKALAIDFETPAMLTNVTFEEFMSNIRENYIDSDKREVNIEAYIPEYNRYVKQRCYLADIKAPIYGTYDGKITYDSIPFSFVGGLA